MDTTGTNAAEAPVAPVEAFGSQLRDASGDEVGAIRPVVDYQGGGDHGYFGYFGSPDLP